MQPPDDGFMDRFLPSYPVELPAVGEQWREVSQETLDAWSDAVENLLSLGMVEEGDRPRPFLVHLTSCGKQAWVQFTEAHAEEINARSFLPHLVGPWSKLKGYAARLALILHYLRWVTSEVDDENVDGESMNRAARLIAYFKSHTRKVLAVMDADPRTAGARKIVHWLVNNQVPRFQKRDVYQAMKGTFKTVEQLEPALDLLEKHALIRQERSVDRPGPGRKPSPWYEVNSRVMTLGSHNSHNPQNEQVETNSGNSEDCGNQVGEEDRPKAEEPSEDQRPPPSSRSKAWPIPTIPRMVHLRTTFSSGTRQGCRWWRLR